MLKARVLTALVLVSLLLGALFLLPDAGWLALIALVCAGGAWEWAGLGGFSAAGRAALAGVVGAACFGAGLALGLAAGGGAGASPLLAPVLALSAAFWLLLIPFWLMRKWRIASPPATVVVGLVVLVPPALAMAQLRQIGPWVLLGAMALVWVADIAAYFTGRAFGRHKLAPAISPGKTWEGAGGAVAGVAIFGLAVALLTVPGIGLRSLVLLVVALVAVTAVSILGDLFESLLKRQAGVKDSGSLLPGHGGILDRIDSLTSTLPLVGLAALWLTN